MKTNLYTDEYALRRVVERRVHASDQPVALFQDLVDLVLCPLAVILVACQGAWDSNVRDGGLPWDAPPSVRAAGRGAGCLEAHP